MGSPLVKRPGAGPPLHRLDEDAVAGARAGPGAPTVGACDYPRRTRPRIVHGPRYGACSMASSLFRSAWATPISGTVTASSINARIMKRFIAWFPPFSHQL